MVQVARNLVVVRIKDKVEYTLQTALMSRMLLLKRTPSIVKGNPPTIFPTARERPFRISPPLLNP